MLEYFLDQKLFLLGSFGEVVDSLLSRKTKAKKSQIVLPCSLHDLALERNSSYRNVDFFTSDSMLLTYFFRSRLKKKIDRVYGPDLMRRILQKEQASLSKKKHYFLAPDQETAVLLKTLLANFYIEISAICEFLPRGLKHKDEVLVLQEIIQAKPDFVWLGIGSPKQIELASYFKEHSLNIKIFCVGAAFEFLTGQKKQAPLFLQQSGLEWLFRLLTEPKRLWRRYLITIPKHFLNYGWRKLSRQGTK